MSKINTRNDGTKKEKQYKDQFFCGVVMPISSHPEYKTDHWEDILSIIKDTVTNIEEYDFKCELVSESEGIIDPIHNRIVNNLFDADLIICDISSKNPNVFFELGMRLAFDKPVIIIKDDITESPFDTSIIRYIEYDSNLSYYNVKKFKLDLEKSIIATLEAKQKDPNFSPFLKFFKEIKYNSGISMSSEEIEIPSYIQMIMNKLESIESNQRILKNSPINRKNRNSMLHFGSITPYLEVDNDNKKLLEILINMYINNELTNNDLKNDQILTDKFLDHLVRNKLINDYSIRDISEAINEFKDMINLIKNKPSQL